MDSRLARIELLTKPAAPAGTSLAGMSVCISSLDELPPPQAKNPVAVNIEIKILKWLFTAIRSGLYNTHNCLVVEVKVVMSKKATRIHVGGDSRSLLNPSRRL